MNIKEIRVVEIELNPKPTTRSRISNNPKEYRLN